MTRAGTWGPTVAAAALWLTACGNGQTNFSGDGVNGGSGGFSFDGTVATSRAAVVAVDVDADGRADLVGVDRSGSPESFRAWRNAGGGAYAEPPAGWTSSPALRALLDDCSAQDDAELLTDFGVHGAECPGAAGDLAYAVLHVGDGAGEPAGFPALESSEPPAGSAGDLVALRGEGLAARGAPPVVRFSGATAQVLFAFPDAVWVVVPAGLPVGLVDVTVSRSGLESLSVPFTVTVPRAPVLESVTPQSLVPGTLALLRGTDLGTPLADVRVTFGGAPSSRVLALSELVVARVPEDATSGPVIVTVDGRSSNSVLASIGALPSPAVTGLSPAAASPGSLVRITGTDLHVIEESLSVAFGGVRAALFSIEDGSLIAVVPPAASDGDVVVTVGGRSSAGVPFDLTARGAPRIDAIDPSPAVHDGIVTIRGVDLVDLSAWRPDALPPLPLFGDVKVVLGGAVTWFVLPTPEGLRVWVPEAAVSGTATVTVGGAASNAFPFAVE
jgi:hypothetical protein